MRRIAVAATKAMWRFSSVDREKYDRLASHIDKPALRRAEHLIWLGCAVFTKERSAAQLIAVADRADVDYEVAAGVSTACCADPEAAAARIAEASPSVVVTPCAGCRAALAPLETGATLLSPPAWIETFADRLDLRRDGTKVALHASCRGEADAARSLLARMAEPAPLPPSLPCGGTCCERKEPLSDPIGRRMFFESLFEAAMESGAPTMGVEFLSCLESMASFKDRAGVEIRDLVDLVYERMGGEPL